ncbi:hypothetical protein J7M23_05615 [Candidatus Sumerlaeota bacterium]|nr:hypothetical protein [Candidatus Sumerlaeota bacterium]
MKTRSLKSVMMFLVIAITMSVGTFAVAGDNYQNICGVCVEGRITEIDYTSQTLVVEQTLVATNESTKIFEENAGEISFSDLAVGDWVEVRGTPLAPGVIMAYVIVKKEAQSPHPVHITGQIEAKDPATYRLIVAGTPVQVTPSTEIRSRRSGAPLTYDDLEVGDVVDVVGVPASNGVIIATAIIVNDTLEPGDRVRFGGCIEEIDYTSRSLVVNHIRVLTDRFTVIRLRDGTPLRFEDLKRGNVVEVCGIFIAPRRVLAHEIVKILNHIPEPPGVRVGTIHDIDYVKKIFFILRTKVIATTDTVILARNGDPMAFDDLENGMVVLTTGTMVACDVLRAHYIRVLAEWHHPPQPVVFRGFIRSVPGYPVIIVGERKVIVTPATIIRGFSGELLSYDNLTTASFVRVKGHLNSQGTAVIARKIHIIGSVIERIDYRHLLFRTSGVIVRCTDTTPIIGPNGEPREFTDLHPGMLVHVFGRFTSAGWLRARLVKILRPLHPGPPVAEFNPVDVVFDEEGRIGLRCRDNTNTFGFVDLSKDGIPIEENAIYRIRVRLVSDQTDPSVVPTIRLRVSINSFEKVQTMVINSTGNGEMSPTVDGKTYDFYFVPPAGIGDDDDKTLNGFISLDLINFDSSDAAVATVYIDSVDVEIIPSNAFEVLNTVYNFTFDGSSEGWIYHNAEPTFSEPLGSLVDNCLALKPQGLGNFGYWSAELPDAVLTGTELYRARFIVKSDATDPHVVPTMRLRLMDVAAQLGVGLISTSVGPARYSPSAEPACYELYYQVPEDTTPPDDDYLTAAFDIIHFDADDEDISLLLDQAIIELIRINQ